MKGCDVDYEKLCSDLLKAESESEVITILEETDLLDPVHWKVLGDMGNNRTIVDNQQQDPSGALVEKIVNGIDAMLIKECLLHGIDPDSKAAPQTMLKATEKFFGIKDGNLANLTSRKLTDLAEDIQVMATGSKSEPCYLIIDRGEGQTPARFKETFLSLKRANKEGIPFVQGKYNCGGTGVLPFCGKHSYQLIISRRCPDLSSEPKVSGSQDSTHRSWGFTLVRRIPPSAGIYRTTTYVYLAPEEEIPSFEASEILAFPEAATIGDETDEYKLSYPEKDGTPIPYRRGLPYGTVLKLYNYRWKARSLATTEARFELEKYLYNLCLPIRVVETRKGYNAHYFATTISGTAVTISKDKDKEYLEDNFPLGGQICPEGIGKLPISVTLYRAKTIEDTNNAKDPRRLPKGLYFTINGQVHYSMGPEFFVTRGLKYEYIKDTLLVTVDCTGLPQDVREMLIMPSRDRLRKIDEFEMIMDSIVEDLKDRQILRSINDQRRLNRVKEALNQDAVKNVLQSLINKNPTLSSLFKNGKGLRNPFQVGPEIEPPYKGKLPPTYFNFVNGKTDIEKSFPIDRTCRVELETDAVNGYFELPDPVDRGQLEIKPECCKRWNLLNGCLTIVLRAPSNAKIGDTLKVTITITDPNLKLVDHPSWVNTVTLKFTEGGKETKPSSPAVPKQRESQNRGLPNIIPVHRANWPEHSFDEFSALHISLGEDDSYDFFVNMDNKYLHNELMHRKGHEEEAKFAYQWGLVLIALGVLQELKRQETGQKLSTSKEEEIENANQTIEQQVTRFSAGVASVIIPTVLNLMDSMKDVR